MGTLHAIDRSSSEAQLGRIVEAARGGDQDAFTALVTVLWPTLVAFARTILGRHKDAEDVVQDSLLIAWQRLPTLRSGTSFRSWIWKIVYRQGREMLRRTPAHEPLEIAPIEPIHLVQPDLDLESALGALTPQQRAVVHLLYVEEWTPSEVAAALGVSSVTVRIHRMQALTRLRRRFRVELP